VSSNPSSSSEESRANLNFNGESQEVKTKVYPEDEKRGFAEATR
jgi:hypothetical protein